MGGIIGAGVIPAALEMMDRIVIEACERFMQMGFPQDAEALLLAEVDGGVEEAREPLCTQVRAILEALRRHRDPRGRATTPSASELWKSRKGAFTALATILPDYYTIDGTIPRRCLPDVLDSIIALAKEYGMIVGNVFHAGDGNIHPCIFYDATKPGRAGAQRGIRRAHPGALRRGGRHHHRRARRGHREAEADVRAVPRRRDRGVPRREGAPSIPRASSIPARPCRRCKRCAEWGGMHVRDGQVPRPDIPRF